jgi:hypothetical protein
MRVAMTAADDAAAAGLVRMASEARRALQHRPVSCFGKPFQPGLRQTLLQGPAHQLLRRQLLSRRLLRSSSARRPVSWLHGTSPAKPYGDKNRKHP